MKHTIIIYKINGKITSVLASGETDVFIVHQGDGIDAVAKIDTDEFEIGRAHESFLGNAKQFLKEKGI
jgi:hypothetical protein